MPWFKPHRTASMDVAKQQGGGWRPRRVRNTHTHTWYPPKRFLHFVLPVMLPPLLLLLLRVSFKLWPDAQTMYVRQREDLSFKSGLVYGIRLSTSPVRRPSFPNHGERRSQSSCRPLETSTTTTVQSRLNYEREATSALLDECHLIQLIRS